MNFRKHSFYILSIFLLFGCSSVLKVDKNENIFDENSFNNGIFVIRSTGNYADVKIGYHIQNRIHRYGFESRLESYKPQSDSTNVNEEEARAGNGSGFFISHDGYIITNDHVVKNAKTIRIILPREKKYFRAGIEASDKNNDIAILYPIEKIAAKNWLKLASFNSNKLGDKIRLVGFPLVYNLGLDPRVSEGIISAKSGYKSNPVLFQMSAPIQPGNSGGPIVNEKLEVIGVTTAKLDEVAMLVRDGIIPQNVNFGTKIDYAKLLFNKDVQTSVNKKSRANKELNDVVDATVIVAVNLKDDLLQELFKEKNKRRIKKSKEKEIASENNIFTVRYSYARGKNLVFSTLRYFKIDIINYDNKIVAEAHFRGRRLLTANSIINQVVDKLFKPDKSSVSDLDDN